MTHNERIRSYSVSGSSTSNSGGSDISMVNDPKPLFQSPQRYHVGMSNIAPWLKSLRLHKYVFLFSHQTYEQMMETTEEHLKEVTTGARNKLVSSIQKLKERHTVLSQMERELLCGQTTVASALEELCMQVITPMKPIEPFDKKDVPTQFLKVLDLVYTKITTKHIVPQDEPYVNQLMYTLDKAMYSEAFVARTNLLRERRQHMQRIKNQFPSKSHYSKCNEASTSKTSNMHRQRVRPIRFHDYLPTNSPFVKTKPYVYSSYSTAFQKPFTNINTSVDKMESGLSSCLPMSGELSFSAVTKYDSFYPDQKQRPLFKMPAAPAPLKLKNQKLPETISGSSDSFTSSGYYSSPEIPPPIGMGNIRKWLKSHRLHKYTWVFDNVNYEKIFTFTEEYLKDLQITQGAAHKLANCIEKLKTRAADLKETGLNLTLNRMFVPEAVVIMEQIVLSPMKPMRLNCDTDVGYQLWNVINLVFKLLASNSYDEETVLKFARVVNSAMDSEAFIDYNHMIRDLRMKVSRLGRRMIR